MIRAEVGMQRVEQRRGALKRGAGAESSPSALGLDRVEPGDPAEPDDLARITQLLGDPQADVGRPAEQDRVGVRA